MYLTDRHLLIKKYKCTNDNSYEGKEFNAMREYICFILLARQNGCVSARPWNCTINHGATNEELCDLG